MTGWLNVRGDSKIQIANNVWTRNLICAFYFQKLQVLAISQNVPPNVLSHPPRGEVGSSSEGFLDLSRITKPVMEIHVEILPILLGVSKRLQSQIAVGWDYRLGQCFQQLKINHQDLAM